MWTYMAIGGNTNIPSVGAKYTVHLLQVMQSVIRVQVFQHLVRVGKIDTFTIYGEIKAIKQFELEIGREFFRMHLERRTSKA